MNLADIILIAAMLFAVLAALYAYNKRKKSGRSCGKSCAGCNGCGTQNSNKPE